MMCLSNVGAADMFPFHSYWRNFSLSLFRRCKYKPTATAPSHYCKAGLLYPHVSNRFCFWWHELDLQSNNANILVRPKGQKLRWRLISWVLMMQSPKQSNHWINFPTWCLVLLFFKNKKSIWTGTRQGKKIQPFFFTWRRADLLPSKQ